MRQTHKGTVARAARAQVIAQRTRLPHTRKGDGGTRAAARHDAASLEERFPMSAAAAFVGAEQFDYYAGNDEDDWLDAEAEIARLLGKV